jgi:hypothetical protein
MAFAVMLGASAVFLPAAGASASGAEVASNSGLQFKYYTVYMRGSSTVQTAIREGDNVTVTVEFAIPQTIMLNTGVQSFIEVFGGGFTATSGQLPINGSPGGELSFSFDLRYEGGNRDLTLLLTGSRTLVDGGTVGSSIEFRETRTIAIREAEVSSGSGGGGYIPPNTESNPPRIVLDTSARFAQANGGSYKGRRLGSMGEFGVFSYNWYKLISAGEGGALVTNNAKAFERAVIYSDPGANFWEYDQEITTPYFVATNFRVSEITGAILRVQLKRMDGILADLRKNRNAIMEGIAGKVQFTPSHDRDGDCGYTLPIQFDTIEAAISFAGKLGKGDTRPINTGKHVYSNWTSIIEKRVSHSDKINPYFNPLNKGLNMDFGPESLPRTIDCLSRTVYIDVHPDMTRDDIENQINTVKAAV